jgi:hypothetical protein
VHQNGLYLVIPGMAYGNSMGSDLSGYPGKEGIAQFPGSFFKRAFSFSLVGSYVLAINSDGNAQRASQIGHVFSVSLGFDPPNLMIEMSYVKSYPQFPSPFCQDMK